MALPPGQDFNYYTEVTISNIGTFPDDAQVTLNIKNQTGLILQNIGSAEVVYSFNKTTIHGKLQAAGGALPIKQFSNRRISRIWFYSVSGSNIVRVEAWAGV